MADKTPMLGREEFARATAHWNNTYDQSSADVLNAEITKAIAQGDPGAEDAARRDLARVGNTYGRTDPVRSRTVATSNGPFVPSEQTGSPIPEARFSLGEITGDINNVISAVTAGNNLRSAEATKQASAVLAAGQAASDATILQAQGINQQDEQVLGFLRTIGLDVNDPGSALRSELAAQATTRSKRLQVDNEIVQLESINFFQDPLNFLMAQPKLQALTAQYNQLARLENESDAEVARMQSISDTVVRLTPSRNADNIRQTAQANALAQVKMAEAKASEVTAQNAAGNAKMLIDTLTLKDNAFSRALQVIGLEETIKGRRADDERQNFFKNQAMEAAAEKAEQKRKDTEEETALVTGINLYRTEINGSTLPKMTKEDVRRMPPAQRAAWYEVIFRGSYGNNYRQAIPFITTYGNPTGASLGGNAAFMTTVRNIETRINSIVPDIMNRENQRGMITGTKIKREDAVAMAYDELYRTDSTLALPGSDKSGVKAGNPYAINFDQALAEAVANPNVAGPAIVKSMAEAKARMKGASLDMTYSPTMLLNDMEARVRAGELPPKAAAEQVSSFMALQSAKTYQQNSLQRLNLGPATDWNLPVGGKGDKKINLMDPVQLERYFQAQAVQEKMLNNRPGMSFMFR
jgi:hypothetical protein